MAIKQQTPRHIKRMNNKKPCCCRRGSNSWSYIQFSSFSHDSGILITSLLLFSELSKSFYHLSSLLILLYTHLLFTSRSISIYITLYTPVVHQSVNYSVNTCCLPVSPYLSILLCTFIFNRSSKLNYFIYFTSVHTCCLPVSPYLSILLCTPVVYQSVHIYLY